MIDFDTIADDELEKIIKKEAKEAMEKMSFAEKQEMNEIARKFFNPTSEEIEAKHRGVKLFLGQLVLDNFHLFDKETRNIIGGSHWKHYRERLDNYIESLKTTA